MLDHTIYPGRVHIDQIEWSQRRVLDKRFLARDINFGLAADSAWSERPKVEPSKLRGLIQLRWQHRQDHQALSRWAAPAAAG